MLINQIKKNMGLSSFLKNLFGSAKETTNELSAKAETALEQAKETAAPYMEKAQAFAEEKINDLKEAAEPFIEKAEAHAEHAKDLVNEYTEKASNLIENVVEKNNTTEPIEKTEELASNTMKIVSDEIETNPATEETDDLKKE
ncbi:YtxH domain-containing protein [Flavobacterium sp. W1B]|uniref:YtxH domain-containing protein n=1 Tax=Flavobacterium sp. W1B TaxID=3394146 RepID=UPI0039BD38D9